MTRSHNTQQKVTLKFWLLVFFLIVVFFTGGATRDDVQSVAVLRPVSVLVCAIALMTLRRDHLQNRWMLIGGFCVMLALTAFHLAPIPLGFSLSLAGREELARTYHLAGLNGEWTQFSIAPIKTWNTLASLVAPLAVLLLGIQLRRDESYRLLLLLLGLGALSGLLGLLQSIGSPQGPFYFYRITNYGSAVGLFANRNHAALLLACLFPMLAIYASTNISQSSEQKSRQLIAAAIAIVLVPLVLVTGSRSGLLLSVFGLLATILVYRRHTPESTGRRKETTIKIGAVTLLGGLVIICLAFVTIFFARAEAINRLFEQSLGEDGRGDFWLASHALFWNYFPLGSGAGSYVEAYQIAEPTHLLNAYYLNRAHNDWIETSVTFGVPGLILLAIAILFFVRRTFKLWRHNDGKRQSIALARMAGITIAMMAIASLSDYPLRAPMMMCVFAIFTLWFVAPAIGGDVGGEETGKRIP